MKTPIFNLILVKNSKETAISSDISKRLLSLELQDNRGFEADSLEVSLDDSDGKLSLPSRNATIKVSLGYKGESLVEKGLFVVSEISHSGAPDILTFTARSADFKGILHEQKERSFHRQTIGDIIAAIAGEAELEAVVGDDLKNVTIQHIDQTNESTLNFITRLADEYDAIGTIKNGKLLFISAGQAKTASGKLLPQLVITRKSGDNHDFTLSEGENYTAVRAYYIDSKTNEKHEVIWDEHSSLAKQKVKRPGTKHTQKQVIQSKPVETDSDKIKTLRHVYASKNMAITGAKNNYTKLKRGVASLNLNLAEGNPYLAAETPVQVIGFKAEIDATPWLIKSVTHSLSTNGYTNSIEFEVLDE